MYVMHWHICQLDIQISDKCKCACLKVNLGRMGNAGYLKNEVADWIRKRFTAQCSFSVLSSDMPQVMKNKVIV